MTARIPFRAALRRLADLFRRAPEPAEPEPSFRGMVTTTGADELARRQRLQRIHGTGDPGGWMGRPDRDRLRRDLRNTSWDDR